MFVVIVVLEDSAVPKAQAKPEDQKQGPKAPADDERPTRRPARRRGRGDH
jgi:hypothetical protein